MGAVGFFRVGAIVASVSVASVANAATIAFPAPYAGPFEALTLRFDIAGVTPPGEIITEARFSATLRATPPPSPPPFIDTTLIPETLVDTQTSADGQYGRRFYRSETINRYGARPTGVAFGVGDLEEAERDGRLQRVALRTTPVSTSESFFFEQRYNLVNPGVDLGNCEEDSPSWVDFLISGPPDDCTVTQIDRYTRVTTTVIETPNTLGVLIDVALTGSEIAVAAQNGYLEFLFKADRPVELADPMVAFKSLPTGIDPGDTVTPVPIPSTAVLLLAGLAGLVIHGRSSRRA